MDFLRTPSSQFENIEDYPFTENYFVFDNTNGMRMHYVDEIADSIEIECSRPTILMMHGEPSWSYLYRKMIVTAVESGYRVIAPDLIGFGKSDKPTSQDAYTYANHLHWLRAWLDSLQLTSIHLICQDWGGLLGLRLVTQNPSLFASVTCANTFLPTGDEKANKAFDDWQHFSQTVPEFPVGGIIQQATQTELEQNTVSAYDAPYPTEKYKAGARKFPLLVPTTSDNPESENNRQAWEILSGYDRPFLTLFSDADPVTAGAEKVFQKRIPGCANLNHKILKGGGHFLQEDVGDVLINEALKLYREID